MNLIKVGERIINMDLVTNVCFDWAEPGEVTICFTNGRITIKGQEAEALRYHLDTKATNLDRRYQEHLERLAEVKWIEEWHARFEEFADSKGIKDEYVNQPNGYATNPRYGYRVFLQQNNAPQHWQEPNEETYAQFLVEQEQPRNLPAEITW